MSRPQCGPGRWCQLCWITMNLPRWIAEPLVRWKRYRKPDWVASRSRVYPRFFGRT